MPAVTSVQTVWKLHSLQYNEILILGLNLTVVIIKATSFAEMSGGSERTESEWWQEA